MTRQDCFKSHKSIKISAIILTNIRTQ